MNNYMTKEEGQKKAIEMLNIAKSEVMNRWSEWKEKTPAFIEAYRKLNEAQTMCRKFGVRI